MHLLLLRLIMLTNYSKKCSFRLLSVNILVNMKKGFATVLIFAVFAVIVVNAVTDNQSGDERVALRAQGMDY